MANTYAQQKIPTNEQYYGFSDKLEIGNSVKELFSGDSAEFLVLFQQVHRLVIQLNKAFNEANMLRLEKLCDYLYENFRTLFKQNAEKVKVSTKAADEIIRSALQSKTRVSDAMQLILKDVSSKKDDGSLSKDIENSIEENKENAIKDVIDAMSSKLLSEEKENATLDKELKESSKKTKSAADGIFSDFSSKINSLKGNATEIESFVRNTLPSVKRLIGIVKEKVDALHHTSISLPTANNTISPILEKNSGLSKNVTINKRGSLMSFKKVIKNELPRRADAFHSEIRPIIEDIVRSERNLLFSWFKQKTKSFSSLTRKHAAEDMSSIFNVSFGKRFNVAIIAPLKKFLKSSALAIAKWFLTFGFLKLVLKGFDIAFKVMEKAMNFAFDLIEGTFVFAYNRVVLPLAKAVKGLFETAIKAVKIHKNNPLIDFLKTYVGAYSLGYVFGLISVGVRGLLTKFFKKESEDDAKKTKNEEEKQKRLQNAVSWITEKTMFVVEAFKKTKVGRFVVRFANWWTKNKIGDLFKKFATGVSKVATSIYNSIVDGSLVARFKTTYRNLKKLFRSSAVETAVKTTGIGGVLKLTKHGLIGRIIQMISIAMLGGSLATAIFFKQDVNHDSAYVKRKYRKYFKMKDGIDTDIESEYVTTEFKKDIREALTDFSKEKQDMLIQKYGGAVNNIIKEGNIVDSLFSKLEKVEDIYSEIIENEGDAPKYRDIELFVKDINTTFINGIPESLIPEDDLRKWLKGKNFSELLAMLNSLLTVRMNLAQMFLNDVASTVKSKDATQIVSLEKNMSRLANRNIDVFKMILGSQSRHKDDYTALDVALKENLSVIEESDGMRYMPSDLSTTASATHGLDVHDQRNTFGNVFNEIASDIRTTQSQDEFNYDVGLNDSRVKNIISNMLTGVSKDKNQDISKLTKDQMNALYDRTLDIIHGKTFDAYKAKLFSAFGDNDLFANKLLDKIRESYSEIRNKHNKSRNFYSVDPLSREIDLFEKSVTQSINNIKSSEVYGSTVALHEKIVRTQDDLLFNANRKKFKELRLDRRNTISELFKNTINSLKEQLTLLDGTDAEQQELTIAVNNLMAAFVAKAQRDNEKARGR